jgi:hypothetical protein
MRNLLPTVIPAKAGTQERPFSETWAEQPQSYRPTPFTKPTCDPSGVQNTPRTILSTLLPQRPRVITSFQHPVSPPAHTIVWQPVTKR